MKIINISYQTKREPLDFVIYYPEDGRTPNERLEFMKDLAKKEGPIMTIVSACPYIIEAACKLFKDRYINFCINNKACSSQEVFEELAKPMREIALL